MISSTANKATAAAAGAVTSLGLMGFHLPGGKLLRDATGAEIKTAADQYIGKARTMLAEGRWLTLVAEAMEKTPNSLVRDVLTEKRLWTLKARAESEAVA